MQKITCTCGKQVSKNRLKCHIKTHSEIEETDIPHVYYKLLYNDIDCKTLINNYTNGSCIDDLSRQYNISGHDVRIILKYNNIRKRTNSESKKTKQYIEKITTTNLDRYGVINPSQLDIVKQKKINTMLKNHNRINNFCDSDIRLNAHSLIDYEQCKLTMLSTLVDKYGVERICDIPGIREKISLTKRYNWDNIYTNEYKNKIIENCNYARQFVKYKRISKLELKIKKVLDEFCIQYKCNINIKKYSFDIVFLNKNILEINGDYWHANPIIYKSDDLIKYPGNNLKRANDIWERDKIKKEYVEHLGYKVYYIWEQQLKTMTDIEIFDYIKKIIWE